ncbi:MAG: hypothetical protein Q8N81_08235 [bacterium]|nr:hypothetical protein [bacterium]
MAKLRGAAYTVAETAEDGTVFSQTETDANLEGLDRANGQTLTLVVPAGLDPQNPIYYDLAVSDQTQTKGIFVPKGQNRTQVAEALRTRFGPATKLLFKGYPRVCDVAAAAVAAAVQA